MKINFARVSKPLRSTSVKSLNIEIMGKMTKSTNNAVTVRNVYKNYGSTEALRDLSLDFPRAVNLAFGPLDVVRPLLKIIAGLPATSSEIWLMAKW